MNVKLILTAVLLCLLSGACKTKENMSEVETTADSSPDTNQYQDSTTEFRDVKLTKSTTFSGVRSNLAGTRHYQLTLDISEIGDGIEFKQLMVDTISIPFSSLFIKGEKQSNFSITKSTDLVKINAYKNLYTNDPDAPQMVEVVEYAKSGLNLKGKAVVEYFKNGKPYYLEIPEITKLENIYAP